MTTSLLKNEIVKALDGINDKLFLEALFTILNKRNENLNYELSDADLEILNERKANYEKGKIKTFTLSEVREKVTKNLTK